jgi:CxxC motif-containing protein
MLPVRSIEPIPRPLLKDAVIMLARVVVEAPVAVGQVIYPDILGTGIDVIASRALEKLDGDYSNSGV